MKILFNKSEMANITSILDAKQFIIERNLVKSFKAFKVEYQDSILSLIQSKNYLNYKDFKGDGFINKFINVKSQWSPDYWLVRGYSIGEAKEMVIMASGVD
jgi:hypothetical protein